MAPLAVCMWRLLVVLTCVWDVQTAKILLMPALHYSHVNLFATNGKALLDAGHDVMVLTSPQLKGAVVKHGLKPVINPISEDADFTRSVHDDSNEQTTFIEKLNHLRPIFQKLCQETHENTLLMTFLADQKFDLVLIDGMALRHCMYTVPFRLSVPYIVFTTFPDPWSSGVPAMPSFEPSILQSASNEMTFIERVKAAVNYFVFYSGFLSGHFEVSAAVGGHDGFPSLRDLHHRAEMVLVNLDVLCVDFPRISMPHYQFVGGASPRAKEKLEPALADWMSWAPHGVIVVSLGSHQALQKVWDDLGDKLEDALSRLPKWRAVIQRDVTNRKSEKPLPENVRCYSWLPQDTLLGHQRTRLFITHGGNNGQLEAVYHAVPMLTLPVTADHFYNGRRAQKRGYGLVLDLKTSTADDLHAAILNLVSNNTYRKNVRKCSDVLRSGPSAPEKVVWWVEHVLRFGGSHLRPPTLDMPLFRVFMLDVLLAVTFSLLLLCLLIFCCIFFIAKTCRSRFKDAPKTKTE